jgi:hypothetical protein
MKRTQVEAIQVATADPTESSISDQFDTLNEKTSEKSNIKLDGVEKVRSCHGVGCG